MDDYENIIKKELVKLNPLYGKTFCFLGSSVTYGVDDVSFVDYIKERNGCTCIKEAVSGTTLVNNGEDSYIPRMKRNIDTNLKIDHFICQLSTNDAGQNLPLGKIEEGYSLDCFDTKTIIGAIEYIICYAMKTWKCPVSFYTGTKYESELYAKMVENLYKLQEKWSIGIIDLWNKSGISNMIPEVLNKYMQDFIHPTLVGYKEWWTPIIEAHLRNYHNSPNL